MEVCHWSLMEIWLKIWFKYIPPERAEVIIYFDPADTEHALWDLIFLEANTEDQALYDNNHY